MHVLFSARFFFNHSFVNADYEKYDVMECDDFQIVQFSALYIPTEVLDVADVQRSNNGTHPETTRSAFLGSTFSCAD